MPPYHLGVHRLNGFKLGHVRGKAFSAGTDLDGGGIDVVLVQVGHDDTGSRGGHLLGDTEADAPGRAGDDSDFAIHACHCRSPCSMTSHGRVGETSPAQPATATTGR